MTKNLIRIPLLLLVASVVGACSSAPPLTIDDLKIDKSPKIVLGVTGQPPTFQILRDGSTKCPDNSKKPGCIDSPTGQSVIAEFHLRNSPDWRFSRFEICSVEPEGDKPGAGECGLSLFQRLEFGAFEKQRGRILVPSAKGLINLSRLNDTDLDRFFVANINSFQATYYYRVEVCSKVDAGKCEWNEDPRWVNKGRY